jgi:hypothetical protein
MKPIGLGSDESRALAGHPARIASRYDFRPA